MIYSGLMQIHTYNNRRIVQHDNNHYDIEEFRVDSESNFTWAVIYCSLEEQMDDLRFTPAVLVTGEDEKGNEFTWFSSLGLFVDGYNERFIDEAEFRAIYPQVGKVYFSDTVMTGDAWREMRCPLSLSNVQIEAWRNQPHAVDEAWQIERMAEHAEGLDNERTMREAAY